MNQFSLTPSTVGRAVKGTRISIAFGVTIVAMGPYDYGGTLQSAFQAANGDGSPYDTPPDDGLDRLRQELDAMEAERKRRHAESMQRAAAVWRRRGQQQPDTVQAGGVPGPYDQPLSAATPWVQP